MEDRARYVGRAAYLELDSGLHAKLQFVTQGIADRYGALQLSAISARAGCHVEHDAVGERSTV